MGEINDNVIIEELKNTGLILDEPKPENYHSGLFGKVGILPTGILSPVEPPIIFKDGFGWLKVWHDYDYQELQFNERFDTWSCVIFTIAKAICLYIYKVHGIKYTISEMYNAFYAGVVEGQGTTIEKGMESFRKYGWVEDKDYPFTPNTTASQYYSEPPIHIQIKAKGRLDEWTVYWNVIPAVMDAIMTAYKRTPVVLTGYAWASRGDGIYIDAGRRANHAFLGLERVRVGANNLISDTYPKDFQYVEQSQIKAGDLLKELDENFTYGSAHTVWAVPKKKIQITYLLKRMENFYYYWDTTHKTHNFFFIGVPSGETAKFRQTINWDEMSKNEKFLFLALRKSMNQSSWAEISQYKDISTINKKFA